MVGLFAIGGCIEKFKTIFFAFRGLFVFLYARKSI